MARRRLSGLDHGDAGRLALLLGGLTWLPARWGVMTTWETTWLGLGYAAWNRVMLVPLTLLVAGAVHTAGRGRSRASRVGWWMVAGGFGLAWIGVALEFVVGGGLRGGPLALAMAGWSAYVLGALVAGLGAAVVTLALTRDRSHPHRTIAAAAAGLVAVSMLGWPVVMLLDRPDLGVVDQLVVGVAWMLLAVTVPVRVPLEAPARVLDTAR